MNKTISLKDLNRSLKDLLSYLKNLHIYSEKECEKFNKHLNFHKEDLNVFLDTNLLEKRINSLKEKSLEENVPMEVQGDIYSKFVVPFRNELDNWKFSYVENQNQQIKLEKQDLRSYVSKVK